MWAVDQNSTHIIVSDQINHEMAHDKKTLDNF